MTVHVGSHFGLPPRAAQEPGSCLLNRTSNFESEINVFLFPAAEPVRIADAPDLTVFF
jgi:hypothetical protein